VLLLLGAKPGRQLRRGSGRRLRTAPHDPVAGLFDTTPLRQLMASFVPWNSLSDNVAQGAVQGIALCATEICTAQSVIFYQTSPHATYRAGRDPTKLARRVQLGPEHAMASASMPFLFPAVQIDGVCYTDGALRQNTPLNPALRMGADRVLVVSVSQAPEVASCAARFGCRRNPYPGALFLLGKMASILLSQSLHYELRRIEMYNTLLHGGAVAYGPDFATRLNAMIGDLRNATYRPVHTCHIRPSESIHDLALDALERAPRELEIPGLPGKVISRFLRSAVFAESELLETLLFTPTFVRALVELGYRDAKAQRDQLLQLFAP
jgi:NTE family protein